MLHMTRPRPTFRSALKFQEQFEKAYIFPVDRENFSDMDRAIDSLSDKAVEGLREKNTNDAGLE